MKKIYTTLVLLFAIGFTYAQPAINNPTPYELCDENNDGFESFELNVKTPEILGVLNPNEYTVSFYETQTDAINGVWPIYSIYTNINANSQTIYIRVQENANTANFSNTTLNLVVNQVPIAPSSIPNLNDYQNFNFGFGIFNLSSQTTILINGQTDVTVSYYETVTDATNETNVIVDENPYYTYSNVQMIWARVENNTTGCYYVSSFLLNVLDPTLTIVNIPDAGFKAKLLSANSSNQIASTFAYSFQLPSPYTTTTIDTNNDGEIQVSEANAIKWLNIVNSNISNLTGIEAFSNLKTLICRYNYSLSNLDISQNLQLKHIWINDSELSDLNISQNIELIELSLNNNQNLANIDMSSNINLLFLQCDGSGQNELNLTNNEQLRFLKVQNCGLTNLNLTNNLLLDKLICSDNQLTNIDVSMITGLTHLDCGYNQLTNLDISQNLDLEDLYCENNLLINLDVSNNLHIEKLWCGYNQLTNLNVSQNSQLENLFCRNNLLSSINVSQNLLLRQLLCNNNQLTNLDVSQNNELTLFYCNNNQLTNLDLTQNSELHRLHCNNNQLTSLDLSQNFTLKYLDCFENPLLNLINIKNGSAEIEINFSNNPNLQYICADENDLTLVQSQINTYGYASTCNVNSYCSFNPNGNYNTISGNALYDNENDGCDTNDEVFQFLRINMTDGTNSGSTFTNFEGDYTFYMNSGTFTLTPQLENPTYFNVSPATTQISFANANNNTASQDFCITPNGVHNDVEVVLAQVTPARPGFDAEYSLVYKNKGNQPLSGVVSVAFDDAKLDFVSSSIIPTSNTTGLLSWNYSNLLPFENRSISFKLNVNSPQETPAVNNGDVLMFSANITPLTGDEIPADNAFIYNQIVVGSYDPNDIYCLEGESLDPNMIGKYLHYNVRFENIGTYEAENVVVATNINPAEYDLNSLQVLNASHNVYTRINGNNVEFIFENCQLAGSPSGGHGNILFKMKSLNSLQTNDDVTSSANIFFDYNFPIETNDATTIFEALSNQDFTKDSSVKVYPNPAKENVTISAKTNLSSITIYDAQGRIVQFVKANELEKAINISNLSNGIYILDIVSEKGRMVEKLVKE